MDYSILLLGLASIAATIGLALAGGAFRYAIKNEGRMSVIETKLDIVMRHLGLDKDVERLNGKRKSRPSR